MINDMSTDKVEKRKRFLITAMYYMLFFAASVVFVRYALPHLWSFVIAFIVIMILRKPAKFMNVKWKLNYKITSVVLVLLFYLTIGVAAFFFVQALFVRAFSIIEELPDYITDIMIPAVKSAFESIESAFESFNTRFNLGVDFDLSDTVSKLFSSLAELATKTSTSVITSGKDIAVSFSSALINVVICIISTAFGLMDYDIITGWFKKQLSEPRYKFVSTVSTHLGKLLGKYIVSYGLIMLITFGELSLGLGIILQSKNAFMYAGVIAVFDILPIIGSGLFLFPWSVVSLINGEIWKGIGLLILWIILSIIRNIIEPKIIGSSVGMHPLVTLFAMLAGEFIYGPIGIILLPVSIALIHVLNSAGIIHFYKTSPKPEKDENEDERSTFEKIISAPFDYIGKFFVWLFKKIFKKKPGNVEKEMDVLREAGKPEIKVEIPDEDINGSPEAAAGRKHTYGSRPKKDTKSAGKSGKATKSGKKEKVQAEVPADGTKPDETAAAEDVAADNNTTDTNDNK